MLLAMASVAAFVDVVLAARWMTALPLHVWTVYMPDVERSQRFDPQNILFSPDGFDERIPSASVIDPFFERPSMLRDFLKCHPAAIVFSQGEAWPQMPVRYYLYSRDGRIAACARAALPRGYRLVEGELPSVANGG
jgi:hypothetical protein